MFFKILASLLLLIQPSEIVVDKIAAVVNSDIITVSDIDKSLLFYSPTANVESDEKDLYLRELNKLINYKVVFLEFRDQFVLTEEDFERRQSHIALLKARLEKEKDRVLKQVLPKRYSLPDDGIDIQVLGMKIIVDRGGI